VVDQHGLEGTDVDQAPTVKRATLRKNPTSNVMTGQSIDQTKFLLCNSVVRPGLIALFLGCMSLRLCISAAPSLTAEEIIQAGGGSEPASYAARHLYGGRMASLLSSCFPQSVLIPADEILTELKGRKTAFEIGRIRTACEIAAEAFVAAARFGWWLKMKSTWPITCATA
jgi:hypothetical protein